MSSMLASRARGEREAATGSLCRRGEDDSGADQWKSVREPTRDVRRGSWRRGCWLLLFALVMLISSASAASAYDLVASGFHTCAIDENGVTCWGSNHSGQSQVPAGLIHPTAIAAGYDHTCAIDENGVTCWGGTLWWVW